MLGFLLLHGHYQVWKHDEAERIYKVNVQNTKSWIKKELNAVES